MSNCLRSWNFSWLAGAALVAACLGSPAAAQQSAAQPEDVSGTATESALGDLNRAKMHPGNPLELVGLEQGDNDIRARTPALANSNRAALILNTDDAYARTLAMYNQGASFSQPARTAVASAARNTRSAWRRLLIPEENAQGPAVWARWVILAVLLAILARIGNQLWRLRGGATLQAD